MKRLTPLELGRLFDWTGGNVIQKDNGYAFTRNLSLKDHRQKKLPINIVSVGGSVDLNPRSQRDCNIETLEGLPDTIPGGLKADYAKITDLKGCPKTIGGLLNLENCMKLTNLDDLPKKVNAILISWNPDLPMLKLMQYPNVTFRGNMPGEIYNIWKKYYGQGTAMIMPAAAELIKAGAKGNAKL